MCGKTEMIQNGTLTRLADGDLGLVNGELTLADGGAVTDVTHYELKKTNPSLPKGLALGGAMTCGFLLATRWGWNKLRNKDRASQIPAKPILQTEKELFGAKTSIRQP